MVVLLDMTLCRVNKKNGNVIAERKITPKRKHSFYSVVEMDAFLDRLIKIHFPGKIIDAQYVTIPQ